MSGRRAAAPYHRIGQFAPVPTRCIGLVRYIERRRECYDDDDDAFVVCKRVHKVDEKCASAYPESICARVRRNPIIYILICILRVRFLTCIFMM